MVDNLAGKVLNRGLGEEGMTSKKTKSIPKHLHCKKKVQPLLNKNKAKSCEIKGGSQEMAVMVG